MAISSKGPRGPRQLKEIIQQVLEKIESKRSEPAAKVFYQWPDIVGKRTAKHAQPLSLYSGRLIVGVDSPVWTNQLIFLKGKILKKIEKQTGLAIKEIVFKVR